MDEPAAGAPIVFEIGREADLPRSSRTQVVSVALVGLVFFGGPAFFRALAGDSGSIVTTCVLVLIAIGAPLTAVIVACVKSGDARQAKRTIRATHPDWELRFCRLAPDNGVALLGRRPGELVVWVQRDSQLVELVRLTGIQRIVLTAQQIRSSTYFYALRFTSPVGSMLITLGVPGTWAGLVGFRRSHIRFAAKVIGRSPDELDAK